MYGIRQIFDLSPRARVLQNGMIFRVGRAPNYCRRGEYGSKSLPNERDKYTLQGCYFEVRSDTQLGKVIEWMAIPKVEAVGSLVPYRARARSRGERAPM